MVCLVKEIRLKQVEMYYYFEVFSNFSVRKSRSRFVTSHSDSENKNVDDDQDNPLCITSAQVFFFGGGGVSYPTLDDDNSLDY